ncbi:MAG TPA: hypothetical protein VFQ70_00310, partial [Candidatus Saccharimonadaceae bacterium]|nr:hypothetical protein [Candidatus Saccharimonadaceae bacterium]
ESVAYNGYLYVAGGTLVGGTSYLGDIQYVKLNADGSLGTWQTAANTFTTARKGFGFVAYKGYMYILGGQSASGSMGDVQYAVINADGSLGVWQTSSNTFTNARTYPEAVAYNGYLYIMGGLNGSTYYNDVQYAPLAANGSVGAWTTSANSFTNARYRFAAVAYGGYLYIMGGLNGSTYYNDVQYAPLAANGSVGAWNQTASFASPRDAFPAVAANGYVYLIGGYDGTNFYGDVQYASVNSNGTLSGWSTTTSYSSTTGVELSAAVVTNGYMYLMGGWNQTANTDYNTATYAPLASIARIGYYTKLIDLGATYTVQNVVDTSSPTGDVTLQYSVAGTNGVFGALQPGGTCTQNCTAARYVWVSTTLDDSRDGIFADSLSTPADVSDITVNYMTPSTHPAPGIRLHGGKTLQNGVLSPLDTTSP